jgi:hypothetical protein
MLYDAYYRIISLLYCMFHYYLLMDLNEEPTAYSGRESFTSHKQGADPDLMTPRSKLFGK